MESQQSSGSVPSYVVRYGMSFNFLFDCQINYTFSNKGYNKEHIKLHTWNKITY